MNSSRVKTLARLADLHALLEGTHAASLLAADSEVNTIEKMLQEQFNLSGKANVSGRAALDQGNRADWLMCDSQRECTRWNIAGFETVRSHRQSLREAALERYKENLTKKDQMDLVLKKARTTEQTGFERKEQSAVDDRYASRTRWLQTRAYRRMKSF